MVGGEGEKGGEVDHVGSTGIEVIIAETHHCCELDGLVISLFFLVLSSRVNLHKASFCHGVLTQREKKKKSPGAKSTNSVLSSGFSRSRRNRGTTRGETQQHHTTTHPPTHHSML